MQWLSCHRISHTTDLRLMRGSSRVTSLTNAGGLNNGNYPFWFCSVCTSINFYRLNRLTHVYPLWDKPYTDWRGSSSIMPLSTTVIGSFPKPPYLNIPDWFNPKSMKDFAEKHTRFLQDEPSPEREELISRAIKETFNCNGKQDLMWSPMERWGEKITLIISVGSWKVLIFSPCFLKKFARMLAPFLSLE